MEAPKSRPGARVQVLGLLIAVSAALALALSPALATVSYPNFSSIAGLKLNGDAEQVGSVLRLTAPQQNETGSAFTKKRVVDPKRSFNVSFSFNLHGGDFPRADGMAFVVQHHGAGALGNGGGGLGYSAIFGSLDVEFDVFQNPEANDPNGSHVGIMKAGNSSNHQATGTPTFDLYGGRRWAWVKYAAKSRKVSVWVNDSKAKPSRPLVTAKVNLKQQFEGERARVGFTAATGGLDMASDILSLKLKQR